LALQWYSFLFRFSYLRMESTVVLRLTFIQLISAYTVYLPKKWPHLISIYIKRASPTCFGTCVSSSGRPYSQFLMATCYCEASEPIPWFYTEGWRDDSKAEKLNCQCAGHGEIRQNNGRFPFICIPGHGCGGWQLAERCPRINSNRTRRRGDWVGSRVIWRFWRRSKPFSYIGRTNHGPLDFWSEGKSLHCLSYSSWVKPWQSLWRKGSFWT
jgi:hypothetical protein